MPPISDSELDQLIRQSARANRTPSGRCPPPEDLVAYHQRELPSEHADGLREHLARCEKCAAELLQIVDFLAWQEEAPEASGRSDDVRWRKIARAMEQRAGGAGAKPESIIANLAGAVGFGIGNLFQALSRKPVLVFASALVLLFFAAKWFALSQKPRDWDSPRYQALIDLKIQAPNRTRNAAASAEEPIEKAKELIRLGAFVEARSKLRRYIADHQNDWRAHYLLGLAHVSSARRILIIDFYFDQTELDRAIAALQRAHTSAASNEAAAEEIFWLLGRAYVMRGEYGKAAEQYRAIAQMQYPGQVRQPAAEQALRDLAAIHDPDKPED